KFRSTGAKIADRREATDSKAAPGQALRRRSCGDCGGSKGALGEDQARNRDASPAAGAAGIRSGRREKVAILACAAAIVRRLSIVVDSLDADVIRVLRTLHRKRKTIPPPIALRCFA